MAVKHIKISICALMIVLISLQTTSLGSTTKSTILHTKKEPVTLVKTSVAIRAIDIPVTAKIKPTTVSLVDTKQIYVPNKILPFCNLDGNIRIYDFDRHFSRQGTTDQIAFSLGGKINALTNLFFDHFRLGGTIYTAQSIGMNPTNPQRQDKSLPAKPLTALGQAFLQFENPYFMGRIGDILINTPWMNPADTRMIPATYRAIYGVFAPWQSLNKPEKYLNIIVLRQLRFKSRTADSFTQSNLYNENSYTIATTTIPALNNKTDIGTLAAGALYGINSFYIQAWAYKFYDYSRIYYADFKYNPPTEHFFKPIISAQIMHSPADGNNVIGNLPGLGTVNSSAWGILAGGEVGNGMLLFAWNNMPKKTGGYRNGDIVSPYTSGYTTDPLYTTSMTGGLIEKAAGSARKIIGTYSFLNHQIAFGVTGAQYFTQPFLVNSSEIDLDVIFMPIPIYKRSLSIRGRMGFANHTLNGKLTYSRLMIQYDFT